MLGLLLGLGKGEEMHTVSLFILASKMFAWCLWQSFCHHMDLNMIHR